MSRQCDIVYNRRVQENSMGAAPDKGKKVLLVHANQIISTWERNRAMLSYSGNVLRKGAARGEEGGRVRCVT